MIVKSFITLGCYVEFAYLLCGWARTLYNHRNMSTSRWINDLLIIPIILLAFLFFSYMWLSNFSWWPIVSQLPFHLLPALVLPYSSYIFCYYLHCIDVYCHIFVWMEIQLLIISPLHHGVNNILENTLVIRLFNISKYFGVICKVKHVWSYLFW